MKILYYIPSLYSSGGLERIITFKANYFADNFNDCSITILTSEQRDRDIHYKLSKKVNHVDLNVPFDQTRYKSGILKIITYPFKYYLFKKRFSKFLNTHKPDITISTLRRELYFINSMDDGSIKIGEFHVTRQSYHSNAIKSKNIFTTVLKKAWSSLFVKNLQKLHTVVLLTHEESGYWPELSNKTVIPNPIPWFSDTASNCLNKQVIAVGRYAAQKGFDMLIDSWNIVAKRHPDWILRIFGEGMREELMRQIKSLNIESSCILEPATSKIMEKYCESSIFVLSSRYEGFGMVLIEAMSCGIPVVSFDCPCGPKDIIDDGKDGFLVESGNITELAEKICYLIENEEIRKETGKHGRISAQRFKIENIAQEWKRLFESCVRQ